MLATINTIISNCISLHTPSLCPNFCYSNFQKKSLSFLKIKIFTHFRSRCIVMINFYNGRFFFRYRNFHRQEFMVFSWFNLSFFETQLFWENFKANFLNNYQQFFCELHYYILKVPINCGAGNSIWVFIKNGCKFNWNAISSAKISLTSSWFRT